MKFSVGDRVKFLNETGGGVVAKILAPNLVEVTTSDGFDIPYATKELIKISEETPSERLFNEDIKVEKQKADAPAPAAGEDIDYHISDSLILYPSQRKPENFAAWLAFIPQDQKWLISGDMDVYFVNLSDRLIDFVIYGKYDKSYRKIASAVANPFSRFFITDIRRDDISLWEDVVVQALIVGDEMRALPSPVDVEVRVRGSRFYREGSYHKPDFFSEKAVMFNLFKFTELPVMHKTDVIDDKEIIVESSTVKRPERNDAIVEHIVSEGKAVVDMHIWKLVDDEMSMSKHEKFMTQLDYFNRCLDSAIEHHLDKVVFIHGVGSGKLKEEIKMILDEREIMHKPASMAEYGVGATEVIVPKNL